MRSMNRKPIQGKPFAASSSFQQHLLCSPPSLTRVEVCPHYHLSICHLSNTALDECRKYPPLNMKYTRILYRDAVEDDNIDQYIRDILELIKSQMPNGLIKSWLLIICHLYTSDAADE